MESRCALTSLIEHVLVGKQASTFPGHALADRRTPNVVSDHGGRYFRGGSNGKAVGELETPVCVVANPMVRRYQPARHRAGDVSGQSADRRVLSGRHRLGFIRRRRPPSGDRRPPRRRRGDSDGAMAAGRRGSAGVRPLRL